MSRPIFRGWVVVGAAFAVLFFAYGTQYSFGVFFSALLAEFGWSRASLSGAFSLYAFAYCLIGALAGRLTDRWGPRIVVAAGGVFLGIAFAGMAFVSRLWQPYVLYGVVAALGMGSAYVPCNTTVVRWFVRRRGLAVGIAGAGGSAGTFVLPPLAQLLVGTAGWRTAYVVFGLGIFAVLNLAAPLMRRDPESLGLRPDGIAEGTVTMHASDRGWALRDAVRTRALWLLVLTFTGAWLPVFVPLVHIVPFSRDLGFSPLIASTVVSVTGLGAIVGRVGMGAVSDRFGRRSTGTAALAVQALSFVGFATTRTLPALYVTAALFGYAYGALSALFPAIVGDFFGRERAGAIVGFVFAVGGSIGSWGPAITGFVYDATGTYRPAFLGAAAVSLGALILLAFARPPGAPPGRRADVPSRAAVLS